MSTNANFFVLTGAVSGTLSTSSATTSVLLPCNAQLVAIYAYVGTAPVGATLILSPSKNGTDLLSDARSCVIADGAQSGSKKVTAGASGNYIYTPFPDDLGLGTFAAGDAVGVSVNQVGSSTAGADLKVSLLFQVV